MAFESIGSTLSHTPRRSSIRPALLALRIEKEAEKILPAWAKMRSFSARGGSAFGRREGRLVISSPTPAHSQEVFLYSRQLIKKINEAAGEKVVQEVRYKVTLESSPA
ncbi:hypothetical protein A2797_01465 [candidate division WWE3 bacterium RIFCSPHIGHO2_01_FULL_48_15]|uniref:DUF721 domain-containing protein n=1 Tax=candidate division WWE3 bacterium RIFCSPHIGHO2_01_FULL_48_15 TaxID=1802619 RepID=A0A1F4VC70_UNCKA|nr:MAG: hypothetical protein A2797_01465 [candidate division WWE3 bacterium RIFCSPHIGHO2_01_FULL_48_15]